MSHALGDIERTLGVDLANLPMTVDDAFVERVRSQVAGLPKKDHRILLLSNSAMKFHERTFLLFFNALGLERCDCVAFDSDGRSFHPELRHVRYLSAEAASDRNAGTGPYDLVISFDSNQKLPWFRDAAGAPGAKTVHVGRTRENLAPGPEAAEDVGSLRRWVGSVRHLRAPAVRVYSTLRNTLTEADFRAGLGDRRIDYRADIDLPPNIDTYFETPTEPRIPYLVLGGGDRDYGFLLENRDVFDGRVLVTSAEVRPGRGDEADRQNRIIETLRKDPKFVCVSYLNPELYIRAILHSRAIVIPFTGEIKTDYTSISDAIWYGKPVLTNRVQANAHLADRVTFYRDARDLRVKLGRLRETSSYREQCERTKIRARANHNLHELLLTMYGDL